MLNMDHDFWSKKLIDRSFIEHFELLHLQSSWCIDELHIPSTRLSCAADACSSVAVLNDTVSQTASKPSSPKRPGQL